MSSVSKPAVIRSILSLCLATTLLFLEPTSYPQTEFEKAHSLLAEISSLQKKGRDGEGIEKLTKLVNSVPQEVQQLLNKGLVDFLNTPGPHSGDELQKKLVAALQIDRADPYQPEVFVFPLEQGGSFVVAYNVAYCATCSRAWIGLIGKRVGHYEVLSEDDGSFDGKSLHVTPLRPGGDGKDRFLVYGTNWGDAHNRLSLTAYSFADNQLKSAWSRKDLPQGAVKVTPTEIILSFLTSLTPPWSEKTEIYSIFPESIQLKKSSERLNP